MLSLSSSKINNKVYEDLHKINMICPKFPSTPVIAISDKI
jgi:hypothetical protein